MSQFPPTSQDFSIPAEPPAWPKVIGIISIVWGSLGLICNTCTLGATALMGSLVQMVPPEQQAEMQRQMQAQSGVANMAIAALGLVLSLVLIFAGVCTLRRQAIGRTLHLAYGAIGLVLTLVGAGLGIVAANKLATGAADPAQAQQARVGGLVGAAFGGCLGMAYPLFCLVWFGFVKRTPESMGSDVQEPMV